MARDSRIRTLPDDQLEELYVDAAATALTAVGEGAVAAAHLAYSRLQLEMQRREALRCRQERRQGRRKA